MAHGGYDITNGIIRAYVKPSGGKISGSVRSIKCDSYTHSYYIDNARSLII